MLMFWTALGSGGIATSVVTFFLHSLPPRVGRPVIEPQFALAVIGVLVIGYVHVVYPAVTRLTIGPEGIELQGLLRSQNVSWGRVARITSVSALEPAGRGGNMSGLRLRDDADRLIAIIPDVFTLGRERLRVVLENARSGDGDPMSKAPM